MCGNTRRYHAQKISVAGMRMLRWICGNTRRNKVRNKDIRSKISVTSIKEKMRKNRLRWFDHVRCRPTDATAQQVERIKLGQVKRAQGDRRKYEWR